MCDYDFSFYSPPVRVEASSVRVRGFESTLKYSKIREIINKVLFKWK